VGPAAALAALVSVALLSGCGDDGLDVSDTEAAALAALTEDDLSTDEQRCLLGGLIETGIDPVEVVDGTLAADQDATMLAVTVECIDDLTRIPAFVDSFIAGAAEEGVTLTPDQARCAIGSLGEDGDAAAAIADCITIDDGDAVTYGDDAVLDLLWDGCTAGNNQICDELFQVAAPGSGYAEHGRTCAGRLPGGDGFECFAELDDPGG
jgi:hypothetical protein